MIKIDREATAKYDLCVDDLCDWDVGNVYEDDEGDLFIWSFDEDVNDGYGCFGLLWLGGNDARPGRWSDADGFEGVKCRLVSVRLVIE